MKKSTIVKDFIRKINESGMTRKEICEMSGVSKSWLDKVLQGKKTNIMTDQYQAVMDVIILHKQ